MNEASRRFSRTAIGVEEALRRILSRATPSGVEFAPLADAYGRVCAERIAAFEPVPHFRR